MKDQIHSLDEALREALAPESAPADLRRALVEEARRRDRSRRLQIWRPLAAALLVASMGGLVFTSLWRARSLESPAIAKASLANFMSVHHLDFEGVPPKDPAKPDQDCCARWSKSCVGFEASLPECCKLEELKGGRACTVAGREAAYYLLNEGRGLYVFEKPIRGADAPDKALAVAAGFRARAWNEKGRGYVMVEPHSR
jgi:hypothetical protein